MLCHEPQFTHVWTWVHNSWNMIDLSLEKKTEDIVQYVKINCSRVESRINRFCTDIFSVTFSLLNSRVRSASRAHMAIVKNAM